jgi:two-component system nitrogen regulation response regulator GlnG
MDLFQQLHEIDGKTPIILMTGQGTANTAIEAMRMGAYEYVLKPLDPDTLIPLVESAIETSRLMRIPAHLPGDHVDGQGDQLIGSCPAMQEVYRAVGRVASQDVTALILGESGTGKEVIARAIYSYSRRSSKPFLAINCAAIPEQLLESELFGHEKGAFTGADRQRIGKFEQCSGGTLFLDEIGDMPLLMQTKILRVLQDQTFERVGGTETIHTNVRLIAATNRNLKAMIETREFRSDLFYRLNVYAIHIPPLRDRGDDIRQLAEFFCRAFAGELGKKLTGVAPESLAMLKAYQWPGNVREMQSVIKHALLEATGPVVVPAFLPSFIREFRAEPASPVPPDAGADALDQIASSTYRQPTTDPVPSETIDELIDRCRRTHGESLYDAVIEHVERRLITKVLDETVGNRTDAAKVLGITRTTIRAKMTKLGIGVRSVVE